MEIIGREKFEEAKNMAPTLRKESKPVQYSKSQMEEMMSDMENPVKFQKELAVKIKVSLDHQMKIELETKGLLSDHTRRWVESYNKILDRIQVAIHGDKSVNLHLHKVSHSDISNKIRESVIELEPLEKKSQKTESES